MIPVLGVPTLNRADLLARMIGSIDHPVAHLVIIDNGRQQLGHIHTPPEVDQVTITRTAGNLGVAGSWNLIIKSTPHAPWWLIVNDDAWFPTGALARIAELVTVDALTLTNCAPPWACYAIGEDVVRRVGLFDERFHPAYCEDNDYQRRCQMAGVEIVNCGVAVNHDNSSTIGKAPNVQAANSRTFGHNVELHHRKSATNDNTADWSLDRRRLLDWEG